MRWPKRHHPGGQVLDLRSEKKAKHNWARLWLRVGATALILAVLIGAGYAIYNFTRPPDLNNVSVIERLVGHHYLLPTGETPTLATVTDKSKLQTPFLQQADDGDKILIYEKAGVAIIYRSSIDRIIAVGPVEVQPLKTNGQ